MKDKFNNLILYLNFQKSLKFKIFKNKNLTLKKALKLINESC